MKYEDVTEIIPGLWQGMNPMISAVGPQEIEPGTFDVVVCLSDLSSRPAFGELVRFLHWPMSDGNDVQEVMTREIASSLAEDYRAGRRILVHCDAGLNRAGLVVARTLMDMGVTAREAIDVIREKRQTRAPLVPLFNKVFEKWLLDEVVVS